MPNVDLTDDQWQEVYYALGDKVEMIKKGHYGPEDRKGENRRWMRDIREIMEEIEGSGAHL